MKHVLLSIKISLLLGSFALLVVLLWPALSQGAGMCDGGPTVVAKAMDRYFPAFLASTALMNKMDEDLAPQRAKFADLWIKDPKQAIAEGQRLVTDWGYTQKIQQLVAKHGITESELNAFTLECVVKQLEVVRRYLESHPAVRHQLEQIAPEHLLLHQEVRPEEVTEQVIERMLPALIEESERQADFRWRLQSAGGVPEKEAKVRQEGARGREEFLRRRQVSEQELNRWRETVLISPLTQEYVKGRPDMKVRFESMIERAPCRKDPSRPGCADPLAVQTPSLPPKGMRPEDVPSDVIRTLLPLIIEEAELGFEREVKLDKIEKTVPKDQRESERKKLEEAVRSKRQALLRAHGLTADGLNAWSSLVVASPMTREYLHNHPELEQRYRKITRSIPSCQEDPYQQGCETFLKRCQQVPETPGCEKVTTGK